VEFNSESMIVTRIDNVVPVRGLGHIENGFKEFGLRKYHGLVIQLEGGNRYVIEERLTLCTQPGDILYLPKGRPYRVYPEGDRQTLCQCVNFHLLEDPSLDGFIMQPARFSAWQDLFSELLQLWSGKKPGYGAASMACVYKMLEMLEIQLAEQHLPARRLKAIRRACDYMEAHLSRTDLSVEEAAEVSSLSASHFRRQFRMVYGVSPKQYLLSLRISRARELLTGTDFSVTVIAETVGFDSIYHFSKAFKALCGMSPLAYREEFKA